MGICREPSHSAGRTSNMHAYLTSYKRSGFFFRLSSHVLVRIDEEPASGVGARICVAHAVGTMHRPVVHGLRRARTETRAPEQVGARKIPKLRRAVESHAFLGRRGHAPGHRCLPSKGAGNRIPFVVGVVCSSYSGKERRPGTPLLVGTLAIMMAGGKAV